MYVGTGRQQFAFHQIVFQFVGHYIPAAFQLEQGLVDICDYGISACPHILYVRLHGS